MAELKIKADSGGGTVSLKGPATTTSNAAVQLTLPVDDGTANQYLKTDGSGALSWATVDTSIADDSITEAKLDIHAAPSGTNKFLGYTSNGMEWAVPPDNGKILQVVGSSYNTSALINTTTKTTTSMYQEITPSKSGSKMLFWCAGHYSQNHNGGQHGPQVVVSIYKKVGSGSDTEIHQVTYDYTADNNNVYYSHHFAASYFDNTATSNTSDVIRYTIYAKCLYANHQMRFNPSGYTSFIVQEYDA